MTRENHIKQKDPCERCKTPYGLKTALYSGDDNFPLELAEVLDYIKYGHYDKNKGGLTNPATNQKFLKKENDKWIDITHRFWKRRSL